MRWGVRAAALAASVLSLTADSRGRDRAPFVSIIKLIANPEQYDGRLISTMGYVVLAREDEGIFLSKTDYDAGVLINGIHLVVPESARTTGVKAADHHYCFVTGVFVMKSPSTFSGEIRNVQTMRPLPSVL